MNKIGKKRIVHRLKIIHHDAEKIKRFFSESVVFHIRWVLGSQLIGKPLR